MNTPTLEVCCFTLQSCIIAMEAGAQRIELCTSPHDGGTTPSYGTIRIVKEKIGIPVYPIIRPRGGDFLYDEDDFDIMRRDIGACKVLGCEGVVIGALLPNGSVNYDQCARLVEAAGTMDVTFHRAFDRTNNPFQALEDIIHLGIRRILTSGQVPAAPDGATRIRQLIQQADNRLSIMPGAGIRSTNVLRLAQQTGAHEFHTSGRIQLPTKMQFVSGSMHEQLTTIAVQSKEIRAIRTLLEQHYPAQTTHS